MEEPHQGGASPASAHNPAVRGREMGVAPTLLANQNAPTGPEIEAGALRALKETTRMAPEDTAGGVAAINAAMAARSGTMRMNPPDSNAYQAGPSSVLVNPAYAAGQVPQIPPSARGPNLAAPQGSGVGGWNESTVMRRRPETDRPASAPSGIVGELASLPGTTGFLIGIGLGLGIAAGVVIALLVMR
jgi:hypothetical protein